MIFSVNFPFILITMLIFLYGPDTYRTQQKLKEIVERYKKIHKSGLNLIILDLEEKNFSDFDKYLHSTPMFKEKKLLILKNAFSNSDFKNKFLENKNGYQKSRDVIVFYEEISPPKNESLFKFLRKTGKCQEFSLLSDQKLKNWAKKEIEKYQTTIAPRVLDKLIDFIGNDLWRFSNEIKKLVSYTISSRRENKSLFKSFSAENDLKRNKAKKEKAKITVEDIELLVRPKIDTDIFKTIDAMAEKNKNKALSLLHKHLEKGDSPLYLLSMINFQFRNLLIVKELIEKKFAFNAILRKSGLHPFVAKKSCFQAKRFNFEELKKIYQKIFQVDLNIKTGRMEPETALDLLIAEI